MELERKARQEAKNRSYYEQPEEPTVAQQPANIAEPAQPPLQFGDPGYMPTYNPSMPAAPTMLPASRNPYDRRTMSQMDRLNAAYQDRMATFNNPINNIPEAFRPYVTPAYLNRGDFSPSIGDPSQGIQASQLKFLEEMRRGTPAQETPQQREESLLGQLIGSRRVESDPQVNREYENYLRTRSQPSIGADAFGLAALMGGGNPFMR